MSIVARFLLLCAALLAIPVYAAAQNSAPPLPPGWYSNGALGPFYKNANPGDNLEGLTIEWKDSYLYRYPGNDPLYWYAKVVYRNEGSKTLTIRCTGPANPPREHIGKDSAYIGYVVADDDFCRRNSNLTFTLDTANPTYDGWAIFHNVPFGRQGQNGEVRIEWGDKGFSQWAYPWNSSFNDAPPAVCPPELVTLGICVENPKTPPVTPPPVQQSVLYQADWSKGLNGWPAVPGWNTVSSMLVSDGSPGHPTGVWIPAPYQPNTIDYAVEAEIQLLNPRCGATYEEFGLVARANDKEGILAGGSDCEHVAIAIGSHFFNIITSHAFNIGREWHTYRLEVQGNNIRLFVDGAPILQAADNHYLSSGKVGMFSIGAPINVRSFKVVKL